MNNIMVCNRKKIQYIVNFFFIIMLQLLSEDINGYVMYYYNCEIVKLNKDRVEKLCVVFNSIKKKKKNKDVVNLYVKNMKVLMLFLLYMGFSVENLFFSFSLKSCFKFI